MYYYSRIEKFVKEMADKEDKVDRKILDVGAGETPYLKYFKKAKYFSLDLRQNRQMNIDFIMDLNKGLEKIKDSSFDSILCIQTLEHLRYPYELLKEFRRILKPGGKLFLTTNFLFQIHMAPNDYFRFTKYGLMMLGKESGFMVKKIEEQGGIFHLLSYLISTLPLKIFFKKSKFLSAIYLVIFAIPIIILNLLAIFLDNFDKEKALTINYEVVYQKKR